VANLVRLARQAVELEHAQRAVQVAAVVQASERLLARVAALRERHCAQIESRLGRQDAVVDLASPPWRACENSQALQMFVGRLRVERWIEHLERGGAVVTCRDALGLTEHDRRGVLLGFDLAT
jgi:hypothetical protein